MSAENPSPRPTSAPGQPLDAAPAGASPPSVGETTPASQLTPEEQMALYEKDLKENDWGHQPC